MNVSSRDSGMAGSDGDLMKVGNDVTDGIESLDGRLLVRVNLQAANRVVARS
jgi:hypothetical protein